MNTTPKKVVVLVIGTRHEFQRHQDTMPSREQVRADLCRHLRKVIEERKIDLVAEEAGDDNAVWKHLKQDEPDKELAESLFGKGSATVDNPVPTIAKALADEYGMRHQDIDVDVRADENNRESIEKRDAAMTEKILTALGDAESVLVIVGEHHRLSVAERLKREGFDVESLRFP